MMRNYNLIWILEDNSGWALSLHGILYNKNTRKKEEEDLLQSHVLDT